MIDTDDQRPDVDGGDSQPQSADERTAHSVPTGDAPTPTTPLGTASLWMQFLRQPRRQTRALDALAVKPERWGDYAEVAAIMRHLSLRDMPVWKSTANNDVAYVQFIATDRSTWFLTTVRGLDGLWRVWDLTEGRRPRTSEIFG